jgi:hypothetical protein
MPPVLRRKAWLPPTICPLVLFQQRMVIIEDRMLISIVLLM